MDKTNEIKNLFTFLIQPQISKLFESQPKAPLTTEWIKLEKKNDLFTFCIQTRLEIVAAISTGHT